MIGRWNTVYDRLQDLSRQYVIIMDSEMQACGRTRAVPLVGLQAQYLQGASLAASIKSFRLSLRMTRVAKG
jgi:hypothetical protein